MKHTKLPHTPTPWKITLTDISRIDGGDNYQKVCIGDWPLPLAEIYDSRGLADDVEQAKANSEFIVLACNNHERLVEALKQTLAFNKLCVDLFTKAMATNQIDPKALLNVLREEPVVNGLAQAALDACEVG